MARYLLVDIGAGTMDILWFDDCTGRHYKAVVKSPVRWLAEQVERIPGDLVVTGCEMGGGNISGVLKERAGKASVVISESAALTVHHDLERVASYGFRIVSDEHAEAVAAQGGYQHIVLSDLDIQRIRRIVAGFGVSFSFDAVALCAQDHGMPPAGVSHLDYRHQLFKAVFEKSDSLTPLLYEADRIPATFNRLTAIGNTARQLPADRVYVMDSGMAAILGASLDPAASRVDDCIVVDVATSHTVAAALSKSRFCGFFEYHTRDIEVDLMKKRIVELADGVLQHHQVLRAGGHGAYIRRPVGFHRIETVVLTGPKRHLLNEIQLPVHLGAPLGDNMMTGTAGLLEAVRLTND